MPIIGRHIIIPLLVFGFTVAVQLHAQPLPTDTLSGSNARLKACANKECSKPISLVKANEDYTPTKPGYLTFYRHEKINVFSHYLSPPFNKLWYGEVVGVKPVAQGLFPKNLVKELEVYANQPITVEEPGVDTAVPKASSDPDNTEDPSPPTNEKSSNDMPSEPVNTLSHMNTVPEADAVPETKKPEDSEFPPTTNTATPGDLADGADSDSDAQTASPDGDSPDPLEDISPTPPVDPSADKETLIQATPPVDADTKIDENTDAVDGDGEDAEEGETADGKVPSQDENLNKEISSESEKINQVNQKSDQSVGEKLQLNMQPKEDVGNENNLAEANEGLKEDEGDQVNLVEANKESKERDKSNLAEANQEQKEPSEVHDAEKTDSNLNDDAEKKPGEDTFQSEKEEAKEQDLKELKLTDKNLSDTKESESDDKLTEPLKSVLETKQTTSDQDAISIDKSDVDQSGTRTNTELNQDSTKIDEANEVLKEADSKQAEADQDSISNKMVEDQHSSDANQIKIDQDISEVDKSDSNDIKQDKISDEVSFENAKVIKTEQDQNLAHTKHTDSHNEAKFEHDAEKKSTTNKPQQLIKNQNEIPVDEGKEISNQLETNEDGKLDASLETSKETSEVNVNIDNKEAVKSKETVEAKKTEESQTEVDSTEKTDTTMQEPPLKEASHTEDIPKESDQKEVEPLQNSTHETKVLEKPNVDQKEIESEQSDSNQKIIEPKPNDVSNKQDKPEKDEFKQQTVENNSTINESLLPAEDKAEKSLQSSEQQGDVEEILSKAVSQDGDQLPKSDEQKPEIADPILNISDVENPETKPTESGETKSQDSSTITKENVHETSEYVQPKDSVSTNSASSQNNVADFKQDSSEKPSTQMADTQADSNVDPKEISNEPIKSNEPNNFKDSNDSEKTQHQVDPPIIDIDQKESPAENAWEKSEFKAPEASERNDDTSIGDKLNMSSEHLTGQFSNQEDLPTNSMELETTLEMQQQQVMGSPEPSDIDTDDLFFDEEEHDSAVDDFMYTSSETIAGDSASPHLTEAELNKPTDASLDIGRNLLAVEDEKDVEMVADVKQDHSETKTDPVAGTATENAAGQGESPYPRTLSPSGEPVKYVYTEILAKLENGFERQAWVVASQIPDTFQPMLAREPFGYSGADMVKLGGVGVTLALAIFFYITIIAFLICLDGCVNSSKIKKFAYEALEKSTILQTEAEQLQRKIKDLQNEVIITQGEAQELKDSIASANEEKSELQVQINSLQLNVAALEQQKAALDESVLTVQTQCDQNAGLVTEWQVYSKSQQDLYEAELLKSQHHQVELEASRAALAEAETKLQNSAQLSGEEADQLKQEVEDMKSDFSKKEKDLRLKIDELKRELDDTSREKADTQAKLDKISSQLNEMEEDVSKTNAANEELSSTLELRNSELEILRTCVSELRDATSLESDDEDDNSKQQAIDALLDVSKAKTELRKVTEEYVTLKEEHNKATESIARLEEETRDKERSAASLKEELELVQKDKTNTEGAMAQISKLLAEANLTIGRLKIAAEEAKQQRLQDSQAARVSELRAEISQMEERVAKTEEEYKTNEKDMRKRLLEGEKKAHESWLLHRDSERKVTSLKQELETLRRNYATLEADYQVGEESYRQLQLQMEARERDDASVTESKRPHSRSSMRSSRFEEGHRSSLSPFNGSEAEPPKPVDPLRAPPPASTYKKGERKKKSKVLKARKEESPVNMADNIEWNESLGPYGEQMAPAWGGDPNYSNSMYPQQPDMYPSHPQMAYPPQDMLYHGQAPISQNPQYDMPYLQYQQNMLPGSNMMTPPPQLLSQTPPNQQMQNFSQQNIGHSTQLPPPQQ